MPKNRTAPIIPLVAVAVLGLDIAPAWANGNQALAQTSVAEGRAPARIGDIWSGLDHQPTSSEVQAREKAAGISVSAEQQERDTAILGDIYNQLQSHRRSGTAQ